MNNKLMNQLRLEEYQEQRVIEALNGFEEKEYEEVFYKKEQEKNVFVFRVSVMVLGN